jgi:hypothetical protein
MAVAAMKPKNAVESLREIVQDLLVPELKAIKVDIESLRSELKSSTENLRIEIKSSNEALRNEMKLRDEKQGQAIQNLSDKLGYAIDIRERLAVLEDRMPRT